MRFVHSYWTRPVVEKRWGYEPEELQRGDLLTFALSVFYIKNLGHEIVLYTDDKGKELLGSLPYDEIYTTLNNIPEDVPSMMWAYGKFFAMQNEPLGSIHIDGDVFIKKQECIDKIVDGDYDLLCQNLDVYSPCSFGDQIHYTSWKILNKLNIDWGEFPIDGKNQYNVGVLRLMNQELKDMYFNYFYMITENVKKHSIAKKMIKESAFCAISVIAEQQFLYEMIQKYNYKTKTIIEKVLEDSFFDDETQNILNEIGYEHIIGAKKYHIQNELEQRLLSLNAELYKKVINHKIFEKKINPDELRFVHSYWSIPSQKERWGIQKDQQEIANIWIQSLSVAYLKRNKQKVILHTDDYGKKMFSHLPYDEIYTTLNDIPEDTPTFMWAYGKFFAMQNEPLGSIHIDGDVFIKKQECIDKIKENNYDILLQNIENESDVCDNDGIYSWSRDRLKNVKFSDEFDWKKGHFAYNVGVIRIVNQELKTKYFKFYFDSVNDIKQQPLAVSQINNDVMACPDVILEQQALYEIINKNKYNVKVLISHAKDFPITQLDAKNIGFQHLVGKKKYSMLPQIKQTLLKVDKDIYLKTVTHLKNLYGDSALDFDGIEWTPEFTL